MFLEISDYLTHVNNDSKFGNTNDEIINDRISMM